MVVLGRSDWLDELSGGQQITLEPVSLEDNGGNNAAVEELTAVGTPVFTLISDLTTPARAGYFGIDSRKAGRSAAWIISRLAKRPGQIGILIGSHRYLNQETAEISFRTYFRENAPEFQLLEPILSLDRRPVAYEVTVELLSNHDDIVGIYAAGGGVEGFIGALRDEGVGERIVSVCNELVPETRAALIDGVIDLVIATPTRRLAAKVVQLMAQALTDRMPTNAMQQILLPADLYISENI